MGLEEADKPFGGCGRQGTTGVVCDGSGVRLPEFGSLALLLPGCETSNTSLILSKPQFNLYIGPIKCLIPSVAGTIKSGHTNEVLSTMPTM